MKMTTTLFTVLSLLFFAGCGDDNSAGNDRTASTTADLAGVYEGYAETESGAPLFVRAYIVNDDTVLMQRMDGNDSVTVHAGTVTDKNVAFGSFDCGVADAEMTCGDYTFKSTPQAAFSVASAAGTYKAVDGNRNAWIMTIDANGTISASTDALPSCSVTGVLTSELSGTLPALTLNTNGCGGNDGRAYGVAVTGKLTTQSDVLNILNATEASSTYWFKQ